MSRKIFYGWWIVVACFLISLYVGSVIFYGFTAFFEPLVREFGWSYTQISFAASLRGLEMGLFAPLIGFLVDRFGSRKLIFCGVIVVGFGLLFLSLTQSLATFYGSFLLLAFGAGGATSVVTMTVVGNWFKKRVGVALGVMMSGFGASGLLVPVIVRLIDTYNWRNTLVILAIGMWALGIPLSFVIRDSPEQCGYLPDGTPSPDHPQKVEVRDKRVDIGLKGVLKDRSFWYLNIAESIRFMTLAAVVTHVMPYLSSMGMPRATAGLVAGGIPLVSIVGRFGLGWLGDIIDKRYVMAMAFLLMSSGILAFGYAQVIWLVFVFVLLFSSGSGGSMVLRGAILRVYFGRGSLGKLLGITMGSASIGGIIGPTVAGWAFDTLGSYQLIWFVFSGIICLAIGLILRIR